MDNEISVDKSVAIKKRFVTDVRFEMQTGELSITFDNLDISGQLISSDVKSAKLSATEKTKLVNFIKNNLK